MKKDKKATTKNPDITDRKKAEDVLREREEKFRIIFSSIADGISVVDLSDGKIIDVNDAALRMFNFEREDIIGMPAFELVAENDRQRAIEDSINTIKTGDSSLQEWCLLGKRGSEHECEARASIIYDSNGEPKYMVNVMRDITKRKRIEKELNDNRENLEKIVKERTSALAKANEELRESEEKFKALTEYSTDTIMRFDPNHRHLYVNPVVEAQTGLKPEEFIGKTHRELGFPEHLVKTWEEAIDRVFTTAKPHKIEFQLPTGICIDWLLMPEFDDGKRVSAVITSARDITKRKRAEEALRESDEWHKALVETSGRAGIGIAILQNIEGREAALVFVNDKACEVSGYSREELLNMSIGDLLPLDIIGQIMLKYRDRQQGGPVPHSYEAVVISKDMLRIPIMVSVALMQFRGKPATVIFLRDITEQKQAEEALRESENKLRNVVFGFPTPAFVIDRDHKVVHWNSALEKCSGFKAEEMMGTSQHWRAFYSEERPCMADLLVDGAIEKIPQFYTGKYKESELVEGGYESTDFFPSLGEEGRWLYFTAVALRDSDGNIIGALETLVDITESKRIEEELRVSEERFRMLSEATEEGIAIHDNGVIVETNEAISRLFGYPSSELIGMNAERLATPESWKLVLKHISTGSEEPYESIGVRNDGSTFWCSLVGKSYPYKGKMLRLAAFRDISKRKKAEDELRANEEKYRGIFDESVAVVFLFDTKKRFIDTNQAGVDLLGYSREELLRMSIPDVDADPVVVVPAHQELLSGERLVNYEHRLRRKDGTVITVLNNSRPLTDANGKVIGMLSTLIDITERKRAEEKLQSEQRLFSTITNSAQDGIIMIDPDGNISFWNPAAERIFGYSSNEAIGRHLHTFLAPERYHSAHHSAFQHFMKTGAGNAVGKTLELAAIRKDGVEIPIELSMSAMKQRDSWHAVGIARDITERKHAEDALKQMNTMLEVKTELARQLAIKARLASAAKSEFLANMSHEIRTPMNGIIGMTGLLLDTELTEEQRRYAEIVRSSGESLLGLINSILDFSKIEAGKLELEILDFDLSKLLDDFAATMALRAHDKGLELLCWADSNVPKLLRGDPGRLRQVLTNLAGNAIKFTPEGEVAIRVSVESQTDDAVVLRFAVRDTGIGIPADKIGLLFNKFTQADASATRRYGGTGLGLAISKQLADLMGGRAGVTSQEGKGSEFWFTARLIRQPEAEQVKTPRPAALQNVRVLIVDDNATSREMLAARMSSWGMRPSEAQDGLGALQALYRASEEDDPFRLALIDRQMPGIDGESLGRVIQEDPRLAKTRMVLLTSIGTRGEAKLFEDIGFTGYLTKPVQHEEMRGVLSLALAEQAGVEAGPQPIVTRHTAREAISRFQGYKTRILLAEDNITNQQVALSILKKMGLSADAVANGQEVLKALESIPYDLVLMDCQMPVMDGYEATRDIRNTQSSIINHQVPVIAMTAHAMQGDREKCLEAGMNDYLPKPVSPQALGEVLNKWLPKDEGTRGRVKAEAGEKAAKEASAGEPPVWDRDGMLERLMGDEDLAGTIMEGFLNDIPRQIKTLAEMIEVGNVSAAERQSHTIKGASANVGGERLRAAAFEMEKAAKERNADAVKARVGDLNKEFERLKQSVKEAMSNTERRMP